MCHIYLSTNVKFFMHVTSLKKKKLYISSICLGIAYLTEIEIFFT